jgi:CheY-like chemotaxis protein
MHVLTYYAAERQLLGTETVRALRANGVDARICGLSANDMEKNFLGAGADAFMIKPFPCQEGPLTGELLRVLGLEESCTGAEASSQNDGEGLV